MVTENGNKTESWFLRNTEATDLQPSYYMEKKKKEGNSKGGEDKKYKRAEKQQYPGNEGASVG